MSFLSDIRRFNDKTEKAGEAIFRGTVLSLFGKIIKRTPVDTGRLAGNWQTDINKAADGEIERKGKAASESEAMAVTSRLRLGDSAFIVNCLPYAIVIEDGDEKRRPHGMVKITVAEYRQAVRDNARKV